MNRAFSPESFRGWRFNLANSGPSPQARNDTAPLALRILSGHTTLTFQIVPAFVFVLLAVAPISNFGAAKDRSVSPQLAGYKAVRVHYGPMNQMIIPVRINGQSANLLVDTGSNEIILDTNAAATFGVGPSPRGVRYVGFTEINGQLLPVAFMQSLTAGTMNFGSNPVVLRDSPSGTGKASHRWRSWVATFASSQGGDQLPNATCVLQNRSVASHESQRCGFVGKFRRVPIHREASGALTCHARFTANRADCLSIRAHLLQLSPTPFWC